MSGKKGARQQLDDKISQHGALLVHTVEYGHRDEIEVLGCQDRKRRSV